MGLVSAKFDHEEIKKAMYNDAALLQKLDLEQLDKFEEILKTKQIPREWTEVEKETLRQLAVYLMKGIGTGTTNATAVSLFRQKL